MAESTRHRTILSNRFPICSSTRKQFQQKCLPNRQPGTNITYLEKDKSKMWPTISESLTFDGANHRKLNEKGASKTTNGYK